jgi:hypothetical protein
MGLCISVPVPTASGPFDTKDAGVSKLLEMERQPPPPLITGPVWLAIFFGCIGQMLFGYDTGVVSGAMVLIADDLELTNGQEEIAVCITNLTAAFSCLISAPLTSRFGRRIAVALSAGLFIAGTLLAAMCEDFSTLLLGRATLGIAIGISSVAVPMLTSELAPPHIRGTVVTLTGMSVVFGQVPPPRVVVRLVSMWPVRSAQPDPAELRPPTRPPVLTARDIQRQTSPHSPLQSCPRLPQIVPSALASSPS